ncbi:MAG TPA: hypothetical protein VGC37_04385 [Friedmanniella sp.]
MGRFSEELGSAVRPLETVVLDGYGVAKHELATSRWRRSSRGLYVPGDAPESVAQRIVCAAAAMPDDAAIGGWAAAHVDGADLDGRDRQLRNLPVDVLLPPGLHRQQVPGIAYRRAALAAGEVRTVGDLRLTSPLRTAVDLACWAPSLTEAVVLLDLLLRAGLSREALMASAPKDRRGAVQARRAIALARPGSLSPGETRLRLVYVQDVGGPDPLLNASLLDLDGRFVAMPDLFDEEAGLAMEYDGASWAGERPLGHRDVDQHRSDNVREEVMERRNVIVVRADAHDVGPYRHRTAARIQAARQDGLRRDRRRDRWIVRRER